MNLLRFAIRYVVFAMYLRDAPNYLFLVPEIVE